ncbi:MAG: SDR family NAD(P)-dependent oxidoreductase [Gemmataceae bacterium]
MTKAWDVALVTGASSGIGREVARELARGGTKVGLVARRLDQLDALAAEVRAAGGVAEVAAADVADRGQTVAALRDLEGRLGPVDLLVANAGVGAPTFVEPALNVEALEAMYRVNVFGVVYSIEAVLPGMLARGRGHLVAVSSLGAYKGLPGESGYTSSKAAVNNLMEGFRIQLRPRGVRVTTVCPGFVATPMTAKNRFKMPMLMGADEAARRIVRALRGKPAVFDFPTPMRWLMELTRWLPDWAVRRGMGRYDPEA